MLYICGDSFASSDSTSDVIPWHEQLECVNLAKPGATNLQISMQVDAALKKASFVIVSFTTCVRFEFGEDYYSLHNLDTNILSPEQRHIAAEYAKHFFSLDQEIYRNKCIIESVLQRLADSSVPFLFDQGGFEHAKWGATQTYFEKYNNNRSQYNLWDHGDSKIYRPYFHIIDQNIHNKIAEYYSEKTK